MKSKVGNCCLCGEKKKLTFEHVPPKSAFNSQPVLIKKHEHLFEKSSNVYGKSLRSNNGFGSYTLCKECNNNTGGWYAKDFADFTHQGMSIVNMEENSGYVVRGTYRIKPLNVLKQILTMFMSADKMGYLQSQKDLVEFILDKNRVLMPKRFKVYLYSTLSDAKRMIGYCLVGSPGVGCQKWSEINFQPFGYFLTIDSEPAHEHLVDISNFGTVPYDSIVEVEITTPNLIVSNPIIGTYQNA